MNCSQKKKVRHETYISSANLQSHRVWSKMRLKLLMLRSKEKKKKNRNAISLIQFCIQKLQAAWINCCNCNKEHCEFNQSNSRMNKLGYLLFFLFAFSLFCLLLQVGNIFLKYLFPKALLTNGTKRSWSNSKW